MNTSQRFPNNSQENPTFSPCFSVEIGLFRWTPPGGPYGADGRRPLHHGLWAGLHRGLRADAGEPKMPRELHVGELQKWDLASHYHRSATSI